MQGLRQKRLVLLHEKGSGEPQKRSKIVPPFVPPPEAPLQHSMTSDVWESATVSHKRVFALLTPEIRGWKMAQMLQKPVFALPGCQRTSVNTLLCDTLGLTSNVDRRFCGGRAWI